MRIYSKRFFIKLFESIVVQRQDFQIVCVQNFLWDFSKLVSRQVQGLQIQEVMNHARWNWLNLGVGQVEILHKKDKNYWMHKSKIEARIWDIFSAMLHEVTFRFISWAMEIEVVPSSIRSGLWLKSNEFRYGKWSNKSCSTLWIFKKYCRNMVIMYAFR